MGGSYIIRVRTKRIRYDITLERNISVFKGDSGTGKTTLIQLLWEYQQRGVSSGVHVSVTDNADIRVLNDLTTIEHILGECRGKRVIFFMDESMASVLSDNVVLRKINESGCYFVFITRHKFGDVGFGVFIGNKGAYTIVNPTKKFFDDVANHNIVSLSIGRDRY